MKKQKVIIITGGSSGIGREAALALAHAGHKVYEFSRHDASLPSVTHIHCDVTDDASVASAVNSVMEREGRIDILVSNAGYGISGAIEFTEIEDAKRQLEVNFYGLVRMGRAVLAIMRKQGGGTIVATSSVACPVAIPFQAYYSVSKSAIESYLEALRNEVRPYGIKVTCVRPGDIKTGFTAARKKIPSGDDAYGGRISRSVARMEHDETHGMPASRAGKAIARVALKKNPAPHYTIGFSYKLVSLLMKLLPARFAYWIIGLIYAR